MRRGGLALVLAAGAAAAWLAAPGLAEDAAGQVVVRPAPPGAYTPADPNMIAVADLGNSRIQVFWPNGTFAFKFGMWDGDRGAGYFHFLDDIAVGPNGMIFVTDYDDRWHVRAFHPDGSFAYWLGGPDSPRRVFAPHSVDIGLDGRIAVSDLGGPARTQVTSTPIGEFTRSAALARIQVFSPNGEFERVVASKNNLTHFYSIDVPDVAVGPDGKIVVHAVDIEVFHPNGSLAASFDPGAPVSRSVAVGPDGRIFVDVGHHDAIHVFHPYAHPNGSLAYSPAPPNGTLPNGTVTFGPSVVLDEGLPPSDRRDVAVGPDGRIVVASPNNHSVQVFHPNGSLALSFGSFGTFGTLYDGSDLLISIESLIKTFPLAHRLGSGAPTGFGTPGDVAVGPDGRIVVIMMGGVQVFHPNGSLVAEFGLRGSTYENPFSVKYVAVGPDGRIVVGSTVDNTGKMYVQVFRPDPNNGTSYAFDGVEFELHNLRDVAVGPDGRIVTLGDSGHVSIFHSNGSLALTFDHSQSLHAGDVAVGPDGRIFVDGRTPPLHRWDGTYYEDDVYVFHPYTDRNGSLAYSPAPPNGTLPDGTVTFGPPVDVEWTGGRIGDVAVGSNGRIVVGGGSGGEVQAFHPDGSPEFKSVADINMDEIAVGPDGRIVAVDTWRNLVHVFNPDGSFALRLSTLRDGVFSAPVAVAVGPLSIPAPAAPPAPLITAVAPAPLIAAVAPAPAVGGGGPAPHNFTDGGDAGGGPAPHNFTDGGDAANVTIDVGGLADPGAPPLNGSESSTVRFPVTETVVAASFATVSFPPNVTAARVPAGGLLAMHVSADVLDDVLVLEALAPNGSGSVVLRRVVEVGVANASVVFDLPVRILLEGQAGGRAFYIAGANGTITPIDEACAADDTAEVHGQLGGAGECQMDSADGGSKIIYTYHLTRFGTAELLLAPVPALPPTPTPVVPRVVPSNGTDGGTAGPPPPPEPAPPVAPTPPEPVPSAVVHTCSVSLGSANLDLRARAGGYSGPVRQAVVNSGSLEFAGVGLEATPWFAKPGVGAAAAPPATPPTVVGAGSDSPTHINAARPFLSLPASVTEVSEAGPRGPYVALANGTAVSADIGAGQEAGLWFRLNLAPYDGLRAGTTLVQNVTYLAECVPP